MIDPNMVIEIRYKRVQVEQFMNVSMPSMLDSINDALMCSYFLRLFYSYLTLFKFLVFIINNSMLILTKSPLMLNSNVCGLLKIEFTR